MPPSNSKKLPIHQKNYCSICKKKIEGGVKEMNIHKKTDEFHIKKFNELNSKKILLDWS